MYKAYKDEIQFFLIYIREAHPVPDKAKAADRPAGRSGPDIAQHKDLPERVLAASACVKDLKISLPVLIDTMDGAFEKVYRGFPAAAVVVDVDGVLRFASRGPSGAQPRQAEAVIRQMKAEGKLARPRPPEEKPEAPAADPSPERELRGSLGAR